jgi:hypothetical protein
MRVFSTIISLFLVKKTSTKVNVRFIQPATIYPPRPFPTKYFRRMGLTTVFGTSTGDNTSSASLLLRALTSRTDVLFSSRARRA